MTKAEQFLWCVQTAFLNNQLLIGREFETPKTAEYLGINHVHLVTERAIWAAQHIPEGMSASQAAKEFCSFAFDNLWKDGISGPDWLRGIPL
ncbi:hypothetical protein [Bordetella avium]|uniref:hypothetical protein n=1 Tax=Bordetella avium TaxID=521 RepID=UPI0005A52661|nr:hypothetical protein [Bordetella avium]